jgi:SAM-dependent methyltransferase
MAMITRSIKRSLPAPFLHLIRSYKNREYNNLSTEQIFTKIYESGAWGKSNDPASPFYSGSGSRRDDEIAAYVQSVITFLHSFEVEPDVVDLGCGDFTVGSQVRPFCNRYVACDVVPSLIAFNKARFQNMGVEFKALNLIEDELPPSDIAFVRQVLQHLSNDQISKFIARASSSYKFLVVTEHLPSHTNFKHNADKLAGPGTRMGHDSGVVLTSPPFNLRPQMEKQLCRINSVDTGVLVTTLYGL